MLTAEIVPKLNVSSSTAQPENIPIIGISSENGAIIVGEYLHINFVCRVAAIHVAITTIYANAPIPFHVRFLQEVTIRSVPSMPNDKAKLKMAAKRQDQITRAKLSTDPAHLIRIFYNAQKKAPAITTKMPK